MTGLVVMAVGSSGMMLAASLPSYGVTLAMLFVIASGITLLQVAANPYVAVVGTPETASSRLNLVQALNSVGTMLAPLFGAYLILGRSKGGTAEAGTVLTEAERLADAQSVHLPYGLVAVVLVVLAVVIARYPLPAMGASTRRAAKEERTAPLAVAAPQSRLRRAGHLHLPDRRDRRRQPVHQLREPARHRQSHPRAGRALSHVPVGRDDGRPLPRRGADARIRAETVLAAFSVGAFVVMLITVVASGPLAMWALILVGFFHSIMFPTIFTLGIKGLGPLTEEGSGLLIMAIAGGALVVVQGWLADLYGLQLSFLLTAACELYVLFYALWGARPTGAVPDRIAD